MTEIAKEKVLLVEDNFQVAEITSDILSDAGYDVSRAEDGDQAISMLRSEKYDILISDIVMPGGTSGIELITQVGLIYPTMRSILVTGFGDSLALPADFKNRVIYKPYDADTLLAAIERLTQRRP